MDKKFLGLVLFFIVLLASEETVIRSEAQRKICQVRSRTFKGMCFNNRKCNQCCLQEDYLGVQTDLVETSTFCSRVELRIAPPSSGRLPAQDWCPRLHLVVPDISVVSDFMEKRC
ncbi:PREDICTED: uncharacterized protein LOC101291972 [Fragaria vesca subsp. vesca]